MLFALPFRYRYKIDYDRTATTGISAALAVQSIEAPDVDRIELFGKRPYPSSLMSIGIIMPIASWRYHRAVTVTADRFRVVSANEISTCR